MPDDFERFLAAALAPPERMPDRKFVSRVQAAIALDEQLAAERRAVVAGLLKQLAALFSVAAAVWLIGRAPPVTAWFDASPEFGLASLLVAFVCVVGLISFRPGWGIGSLSSL